MKRHRSPLLPAALCCAWVLALLPADAPASAPGFARPASSVASQPPGMAVFPWLVGAAVGGVAWGWLARCRRPALQEAAEFRALRHACAANDPMATLVAHTRWLATLPANAVETGDSLTPDPRWAEMQQAAEDGCARWQGGAFLREMEHQRREWMPGPGKNEARGWKNGPPKPGSSYL